MEHKKIGAFSNLEVSSYYLNDLKVGRPGHILKNNVKKNIRIEISHSEENSIECGRDEIIFPLHA
jgi:hypothetical protein